MTAAADVRQGDFLNRNVEIRLGYRDATGGGSVYLFEPHEVHYEDGRRPVAIAPDKPLRLPEEIARALYEALGRHFGDAPADSKTTRQDLLHERGRVDKMIDALLKGSE